MRKAISQVTRTSYFVFSLLIGLAVVTANTATANELVGVWLTVDASDSEGKRQGGIYFRSDMTGGMIKATYNVRIDNPDPEAREILGQLLDIAKIPKEGIADMTFTYQVDRSIVIIDIRTFKGIVASGPQQRWTFRKEGERLRLTQDANPGRWILLELAK